MCETCDKKLGVWRGWIDVPLRQAVGGGPWTDLSYRIDPEVPGGPPIAPRIERISSMPAAKFNQTEIQMVTHKGTHVDAPNHYIDGAPAVDEIPLERLYGPAVVWRVDVPPLHAITPADLETMTPRLEPGDIVILDMGWADKAGHPEFARNPSLSPDAAEWLVKHGAKMVAVDTRSPDAAAEARWNGWNYPVHRILLGSGVLIAECVRNVGSFRGTRVEVAFLGLNIAGSDGAPARVVARPLT